MINLVLIYFLNSYTTELFFDDNKDPSAAIEQRQWLLADLREANRPENRAKRPWIIAYGHRAMYCSNIHITTCTSEAKLLRRE